MEYNDLDWKQEELVSATDALQEAYENGRITMDEYAELLSNSLELLDESEGFDYRPFFVYWEI